MALGILGRVMIEAKSGEYFGEDDITLFENGL